MTSRVIADDARQYGPRSSDDVRSTLLELTREFVLAACRVPGVRRIAMLGSLLTEKPRPKDADVLVTVADDIDLTRLARLGRRLKGTAQARLNAGADIFLADAGGAYLGWRTIDVRNTRKGLVVAVRHRPGHRIRCRSL